MRTKGYGQVALSLSLALGFYLIFFLLPAVKAELSGYQVSAEHIRIAERFAGACQASPKLNWTGCKAILKNGSSVRVSARETSAGTRVLIHTTENNAVDGEVEKRTGVPIGRFLRDGAWFVFDEPRFYTI